MTESHSHGGKRQFGNASRLVFFGFVAIAAYFVIAEHRAHVLPFLPFLLFALCPLLHFFHHAGHGSSSDESRDDSLHPGVPPASGGRSRDLSGHERV